jgi:SAM-dependent methyltransferase
VTSRSEPTSSVVASPRRSLAKGILEFVAQLVDDTKFAVAGLQGRGHPKPITKWDEQYRTGHWSYLDSAAEIAHYMVIVGYVQQFCHNPTVLDVGCGHGRLFQLLRRYPYRSYLGIDHSAESLRQARPFEGKDVRFELTDFSRFIPAERFDAIVFNESIYYARRPADVLHRYVSALTKDGVMIVSMCENRWQKAIWNTLESVAETVHSTAVTSENDRTWHVRVLRPVSAK